MPDPDHTFAPRLPQQAGILLSVLLFLGITIAFCDSNFRRDSKHLDFRAFYAAGQMVADGAGSRLYDMEAQREYERRVMPDLRHEIYPFPYPPAAALLYVPLGWLSLRAAYEVWCISSVALLALSLELLRRRVLPRARLTWTLPLSLLYIPIGDTLVNGQTSIAVLAIFTVAFTFFLGKRDGAAGLVLGLALVKFNFVLPFIVVTALTRRYRLLAGFAVGAGLFAAICVMVAGPQFPATYWHFLTSYPAQAGTITAWPQAMPNLRGLLFMVFRHDPPLWIVLAGALPILWQVTRAGWSRETTFAGALLAAALLSYHANLHDLTLLVLPAFVVVAISRRQRFTSGIAVLILLPPLLLVLMVTHSVALAAIPVLFLLFALPRAPDPAPLS